MTINQYMCSCSLLRDYNKKTSIVLFFLLVLKIVQNPDNNLTIKTLCQQYTGFDNNMQTLKDFAIPKSQ